jgi:outer membrane immunogenic protein
MKKFVLASAAVVALALPATAADMPMKAPVYAPGFTWTGAYIGLNAGASWGDASVSSFMGAGGLFGIPANLALANALGTGPFGDDAQFTGGAQIGYNWQFAPNWIVGLEGDFNWLGHDSTLVQSGLSTLGALTITSTLSADWLATIRGRLGFTFDRAMIYATGGVAFSDLGLSQTFALPASAAFGTGSSNDIQTGFALGAGAEWAFAPSWSAKAEYLYTRFEGVTSNLIVNPGAQNQPYTGSTSDVEFHQVRLGVNYRFGR